MGRAESKMLARLDKLSSLLGVFAFATLLLHFGFPGLHLPPALMVAWSGFFPVTFFVESLSRLLFVRDPLGYLRRNPFRYTVLLIILLELSGIAGWSSAVDYSSVSLVTGQVYLTVFLFAHAGSWIKVLITANRWLANLRLPITLLPALSFAAAILAGGLLLWMPGMNKASMSFLDSLFTSTSALCVTGLTVYDIGSTLTPAGLAVLATLIQVGGIGTMTVMGALALWLGGGLSPRERMAFSELIGGDVLGETKRILGRVMKIVFVFEAAGSLLLWALWEGKTPHPLFQAIFHSVSAFCNAGFCLFPTSLDAFADDAPSLFVIMSLIVAGGLGIPALASIGATALSRLVPWRKKLGLPRATRLLLIASGSLLAVGTASFALDGYLTGNGRSFLSALFQAVTTRTAGFQTESQLAFGPLGWATSLVLMAIGASPQSTGGGIKTSVVARLFFSRKTRISTVEQSKACLKNTWTPFRVAAVCVSSYLALAMVGGLVMALLEGLSPMETLFEGFSAIGTVGLSRDLTPALSAPSKLLAMVLMFTGRVLYPTMVARLVRSRLPGEQQDNWA